MTNLKSLAHYIILLLCSTLISCNQGALEQRIVELEAELNDCKYDAVKIIDQMSANLKDSNYSVVFENYQIFVDRHNESPLIKEALNIYNQAKEQDSLVKLYKERLAIEMQEKLQQSLKKLRKKHDDVMRTDWYKNPYFVHYNNSNRVSIYFGNNENDIWLRLKMSYTGDDWIFFERAFLSFDENTIEVFFDEYNDKETQVSPGVSEWIDVVVTNQMLEYLRKFTQSPNAKMRLSGKYTKTRNLTSNERKGIIEVINGYDALMSTISSGS